MSDLPFVIDVGMYDGSDTAYYLFLGYRVISIDANPEMIRKAELRFHDEITTGQLILLNVAIERSAGSSKLFISSQDEGSSTVNPQNIVGRGEDTFEELEVPCVPFSNLLEEYGTPFYLKIDIEGSDRFCLEAIDSESLPSYVSWEESEDAVECLSLMHKKGYTRFKIINQITFYDLPTVNSIRYRAWRKLRSVFGLPKPLYTPHRDWTFARSHSAGPCCEATSGQWRSFEETVRIWKNFRQEKEGAWYDFHAALPLKNTIVPKKDSCTY